MLITITPLLLARLIWLMHYNWKVVIVYVFLSWGQSKRYLLSNIFTNKYKTVVVSIATNQWNSIFFCKLALISTPSAYFSFYSREVSVATSSCPWLIFQNSNFTVDSFCKWKNNKGYFFIWSSSDIRIMEFYKRISWSKAWESSPFFSGGEQLDMGRNMKA